MGYKIMIFCSNDTINNFIRFVARDSRYNYEVNDKHGYNEFYSNDAYIIDFDEVINIKILENIRDRKLNKPVILLGSKDKQAIEGYKYDVFRFIKKDRISSDIIDVFDALNEHMNLTYKYLCLMDENKMIAYLMHEDILYFYSSGNYTIFSDLEGNTYQKRITPKKFLNRTNIEFVSPCAGIYVNPKYIKQIDMKNYMLRLTDNTKINISKRKLAIVLNALNLSYEKKV